MIPDHLRPTGLSLPIPVALRQRPALTHPSDLRPSLPPHARPDQPAVHRAAHRRRARRAARRPRERPPRQLAHEARRRGARA